MASSHRGCTCLLLERFSAEALLSLGSYLFTFPNMTLQSDRRKHEMRRNTLDLIGLELLDDLKVVCSGATYTPSAVSAVHSLKEWKS